MQLLKYKNVIWLIGLSLILPAFAGPPFTDNECLDGAFMTKVAHKAFPFGLTETKLEIEKKDCRIVVRHEKLRYLAKQWDVDVCRGPIHIKYGATSVEVIKRQGPCKALDNEFCKMADELFKVLQDDGLIFAPGEKEDLAAAHGRVNCSYLLMKAYLEGATVFNRQETFEGVLKKFSNSWESVPPEIVPEKNSIPVSPSVPVVQEPAKTQASPSAPASGDTPSTEPLPTAAPQRADF
ncbi:MAG: hypothetical protein A2X86_17440 [Bdellovibrionales bacterium GWA2_49_15]|nr:MAG: hypothetical protein A2X86_17440 [Bdellovibrionales bacterium GWA2_49_15]HAZ13976.1 hypothetical protein [Bdellovibrionales bacterium]